MKKKLLITTLLLPILGFSYELNFSKSFSKVLNSDLLSTSVNISIENKDEKVVNSQIEKYNKFIKENKTVSIKNSNYNLSPQYEYVKDKRNLKGYVGDSRFTVQSKDAQKINTFLNEIVSLKANDKASDLKLDISNLAWEISEELQNQSYDELRLESLIWIETYAKELSSKIAKKCEVKNVNILDSNEHFQAKTRMVSMAMDSINSDITPLNSEQNTSINTNFILDCK